MTTFFIKTLDEKYVNLALYNLIYVKKIDNSFAIVCQNTKETIVLDKYETEDQAKEIMNDKFPYGKPQTDEVARGSGTESMAVRD